MRLRGLGEATGACLAALALACPMTYPLVFHFTNAARLDTTDGRFSVWVVAWVAHALTTNPLNVYHANIFYPHANTLAFSETDLVAGAIGAPVWLLTKNPYATHNTVFLLSFVLSAVATYYLVRYLTGDRRAAAVCGVLFAYCPYIFARTAHIQLMLIGGLPVCLLAFHRLIDRTTMGRAAALGVVLWLQGLACAYYGIFAGGMVAVGSLLFAFTRGRWREVRYWTAIGLAAAVCLGLTAPFYKPYLDVQAEMGFARTLDEAYRYSANFGSWFASAAWAHRWWLPAIPGFTDVVFPGIMTTLLGLAGAWLSLRPPAPPTRPGDSATGLRRDVALFYTVSGVLAFWTALGPKAGLYILFYRTLPVFSFLRAPVRTGLLVSLCLVVLASVSLMRILRGRPRAGFITAVLLALAVADLFRAPIRLQEAEPQPPAIEALARLPVGPVAEFPFWYERIDFHRHAYYMLNSTVHWQPMINGYSDVIPQDFRDMVRPLSSFPNPESFAIMQRLGARYAVFHLDSYDGRSREKLLGRIQNEYAPYLRPVVQEGNVWLYEIVGWPPP